MKEYLEVVLARFDSDNIRKTKSKKTTENKIESDSYYKIPKPGILWDEFSKEKIEESGGIERKK
jgi:hypothetical protein